MIARSHLYKREVQVSFRMNNEPDLEVAYMWKLVKD
jgi:hypothetical protein